jgi:hypothetical protein
MSFDAEVEQTFGVSGLTHEGKGKQTKRMADAFTFIDIEGSENSFSADKRFQERDGRRHVIATSPMAS